MADIQFWLFRCSMFRALEGRLGSLLDRPDRDRWLLKGQCVYSDEADFSHFTISGGLDASFRKDFMEIAKEPGIELGCPPGQDPSKFWLHSLCQNLLNAPESELRKEVRRKGRLNGEVLDLVGSSASFCQRIAAEMSGDFISGTKPEATKGPAGKRNKHKRKDLLDRLARDPKQVPIRRLLLQAWADSHELVANAHSGNSSLSGYVEGCVRTFSQGAKMHLALEDGASISAKCKELDTLAQKVIRRFNNSLDTETRRLGKKNVAAAKDVFSRRIREITARSKRKILKAELARDASPQRTEVRAGGRIRRPPRARQTAGKGGSVPPKSTTAQRNAKGTPERSLDARTRVRRSRARTVANLIEELNVLCPQMLEQESEYDRLREQYPSFLTFKVADSRHDLKQKVLSIGGSARHIRLAQELAAAHHGRKFSTIQDDWKDHKPAKFRRPK